MRRFVKALLFAAFALVLSLASLRPSQARVIYTPTIHMIKNEGSVSIDFDHDGRVDVTVQQNVSFGGTCPHEYVAAYPVAGDGAASSTSEPDGPLADALAGRVSVGPANSYAQRAIMVDVSLGPCLSGDVSGYWLNNGPHYLGMSFVTNGQVHYGWVMLQVGFADTPQLQYAVTTLTGFAYETVVGKPILTGART